MSNTTGEDASAVLGSIGTPILREKKVAETLISLMGDAMMKSAIEASKDSFTGILEQDLKTFTSNLPILIPNMDDYIQAFKDNHSAILDQVKATQNNTKQLQAEYKVIAQLINGSKYSNTSVEN